MRRKSHFRAGISTAAQQERRAVQPRRHDGERPVHRWPDIRRPVASFARLAMTTRFVGRIAVEVQGDGDPVLLIHGLGGSSNIWTPLAATLVRYRTLRPDLP